MSDTSELRDHIQLAVVAFIARVILYNHAVAQHQGLGASDGQFLTLLQVHGPLTAGQLAEHAGLTTGATTGVIDRLERAGFAHRVRDERDRRKVIVVRDNEAIGRSFPQYYAQQAERLSDALATRSADELRVIADFLTDVMAEPEPDLPST